MAGNNNRVEKLPTASCGGAGVGPLPAPSPYIGGMGHDLSYVFDHNVTLSELDITLLKFQDTCPLPRDLDVQLEEQLGPRALPCSPILKIEEISPHTQKLIGSFFINNFDTPLKIDNIHLDSGGVRGIQEPVSSPGQLHREEYFPHIDPFVPIQLNGLNGECTNSDDVKNGKLTPIEFEQYKRDVKEAKNRMRGQIIGMRKHGGKQGGSTPEPMNPIALPVDPSDEKTWVIIPYHIPELQCSVFMEYTEGPKGILRLFSSHIDDDFEICDAGSQIGHVVLENYGCYKIDTHKKKGKTIIASAPFSVHNTYSTGVGDRITDKRSGLVFNPLLSKLWSEFRNARVSPALEATFTMAIKNVVRSAKQLCEPSLPVQVQEWFHSICEFTETIYKLKVMASYSETNVMNNMFAPVATLKHVTCKVRTGVVNKINSSTVSMLQLNTEYDIKPNIIIRKKNKDIALTKEFWFKVKPWPLVEREVVYDIPRDGQATSVWASLADFNRFLSKGEGSELNLYGALKRIFGARPLELDYQQNQANLCVALMNQFPEYRHLFKNLNVGMDTFTVTNKFEGFDPNLGGSVDYTIHNHYHFVTKYPYLVEDRPHMADTSIKQLMEQYKYVLEAISYFTQRVKPTIQEKVVDIMHNTILAVESKTYALWSHVIPAFIWRQQFAEEPHHKKQERLRMAAGVLQSGVGCLVNNVAISVKDELAKNGGKMPRVFAGYEDGVMYFPQGPEEFKSRVNGWHYFDVNGLEVLIIIYAKPKSSELILLFEALTRAWTMDRNHLCVAIYSDDSCYSGVFNGVPFGYNVDISSCDSSNGPPIFFTTIMMLSQIDPIMAEALLEQCCKPMKVTHPTNPEHNFDLRLPTAFEGSGTVLTTCLNHMASVIIAMSVATVLANKKTQKEFSLESCIIRGAALVGHKVTTATVEVDGVLQPSRFQFLKISPMVCTHKDTGEKRLVPVRNLGSIIKGFGKLTQDMQAYQLSLANDVFNRMTYAERFNCFFGAVVAGYSNEPGSPILTSLRTRFTQREGKLLSTYKHIEDDVDFSSYVIDSEELYNRYQITDFQQTILDLLDLQIGDVCDRDPVLERLMNVDYEYEPTPTIIDFAL